MRPKDDLKLEAIERATYQCVLERGLSALTLADIARAAGLATSTIYVYYPSRQTLLDTLFVRAKTEVYSQIIDGDAPDLPLKARVRQIWSNMLDVRLQQQAKMTFLEQYASSEHVSENNRALSARMMNVFCSMLEVGQRDETLKMVPIPMLIGAVVGSVRETSKLVGESILPDDATTRSQAFQLCWDALKA